MSSTSSELYASFDLRIDRYAAMSTALTLLSNEQLQKRVEDAKVLNTGIGGTGSLMQIEDTSIFVKVVPLTEIERYTENVMSTRNMFNLPPYCHYGIGSPGGGVWREVAAHTRTKNWVLAKQCESFPLMYHWRVLKSRDGFTKISDELVDVSSMVEFWDTPFIRNRIEALDESIYYVAFFFEYFPYTLHDWLTEQVAIGENEATSAFSMVESNLRSAVSYMNANGLLHFDVHFKNVLTDGHRVYITDFGIATSSLFELSESELEFIELNKTHDGCYVVTQLVNWIVSALTGTVNREERIDFIRRCSKGDEPLGVLDFAAKIIMRYAPIAVVINDFYTELVSKSRSTLFPVKEIEQVCTKTGFNPLFSDASVV